jgi:DNA-binding transcriptional regulator YiaG
MVIEEKMDYSCPVCDGGASRASEIRAIQYGPHLVPVRDEFMRCDRCNERFYLAGQMEATDKRAQEYAKWHMWVYLPTRITKLRENLRLNRVEFEHLIGTGPKTDIRWEQGKVVPTPSVNALLFLLEANPENVRLLSSWRGAPIKIEITVASSHRQQVRASLPAHPAPQEDADVIPIDSVRNQYFVTGSTTRLRVPTAQRPYSEATG